MPNEGWIANLSALERYNLGLPVNEELAEIQREIQEGQAFPEPSQNEVQFFHSPLETAGDGPRELTRIDRLRLKELRVSEGWGALMLLQQNALSHHRQNAITVSSADPLGNAQKIANAWAYVHAYRSAMAELSHLVDAELKLLDANTQSNGTDRI